MEIIVVTTSASFARHIGATLPAGVVCRKVSAADDVNDRTAGTSCLVLLHVPSVSEGVVEAVRRVRTRHPSVVIGVAADVPSLTELLALVPFNIRAYFNSYMADVHYRHLLATLKEGLCWFAPSLLQAMLESFQNPATHADALALDRLTAREREIAEAVAIGMNNKNISRRFGITERTVKAHLTKIYEKLNIPDRLALALRLKGRGSALIDTPGRVG